MRYKLVEVHHGNVGKIDEMTRNGWEIHSWEVLDAKELDFMFLMEQGVSRRRWWRR